MVHKKDVPTKSFKFNRIFHYLCYLLDNSKSYTLRYNLNYRKLLEAICKACSQMALRVNTSFF